MAHFDETSGVVACITDWGQWWQTVSDVTVLVSVPLGTVVKDVKCTIKPNLVKLSLKNETIFEGQPYATIQPDNSLWTLEDNNLVRICLEKNEKGASKCWSSLLIGQYATDAWLFDQMQKKLTLQRYQLENPGMNFSGAEISGNYQSGGPELPS
ncbi:hypothetical protein HELRODRAFT_156707 [Helobdella robusta]|uniref:CS domain-containing protein n=1 Tax=Helobdella robusta TaxID=6412 RepID=T1EM01_HELRO|nr:hypothetical protein HELRODRAFT_156707 [Helobdella robusta]ESO07752.1 hypothetical protein HELRODRAFT_156707 [Helobdella robusta]